MGERLMIMLKSMYSMFKLTYCMIPFATRNVKYYEDPNDSLIGYTDMYVFGIRIIRLQRTNPW